MPSRRTLKLRSRARLKRVKTLVLVKAIGAASFIVRFCVLYRAAGLACEIAAPGAEHGEEEEPEEDAELELADADQQQPEDVS